MSELKSGDICYTPDGVQCEFDHIHEDRAYVRTGYIIQTLNYTGDDFDEDVAYSDALTAFHIDSIFTEPPVKMLSVEVRALIDKRAALDEEIKTKRAESRSVEKEHAAVVKDIEAWQDKHPMFRELKDHLEGVPFFYLEDNTYNTPPKLVTDKIEVITLVKTNLGFKWRSTMKAHSYYAKRETFVHVFRTEEEVKLHVHARWGDLLYRFAGNPDYSTGNCSNNKINYGTLESWVATWPHLKIEPQYVEARAQYVEAQRLAQIEAAQRRVDELKSKEGLV